jgi:hypothetical protein
LKAIQDNDAQEYAKEEMCQVKKYKGDSDGALQILPKHLVKIAIGRSPDTFDMMNMRMYFELKKRVAFTSETVSY